MDSSNLMVNSRALKKALMEILGTDATFEWSKDGSAYPVRSQTWINLQAIHTEHHTLSGQLCRQLAYYNHSGCYEEYGWNFASQFEHRMQFSAGCLESIRRDIACPLDVKGWPKGGEIKLDFDGEDFNSRNREDSYPGEHFYGTLVTIRSLDLKRAMADALGPSCGLSWSPDAQDQWRRCRWLKKYGRMLNTVSTHDGARFERWGLPDAILRPLGDGLGVPAGELTAVLAPCSPDDELGWPINTEVALLYASPQAELIWHRLYE